MVTRMRVPWGRTTRLGIAALSYWLATMIYYTLASCEQPKEKRESEKGTYDEECEVEYEERRREQKERKRHGKTRRVRAKAGERASPEKEKVASVRTQERYGAWYLSGPAWGYVIMPSDACALRAS